LFHDISGKILGEVLVFDDVLEELATLTVFQNQKADLVPLPDFVQLDNVWVIECF